MNPALHSLIMGASPAFYFQLEDMSAYPALVNLGNQPITSAWKGAQPGVLNTPNGKMAWLKGSEWVELKNGPTALAIGNGFTVESLLLIDEERRSYWRLFELGVNTTSPLISLFCNAQTDDLGIRYWTPAQGSSSAIVTYPNIRNRLRHIMAVVDPAAGKARHYIDGVLVGEVNNTYSFTSLNAAIGNLFYSLWSQFSVSADQTLTGMASYVAVYLTPLTATDAAARAAQINGLGQDFGLVEFDYFKHTLTAVPINQEPRAVFQPQDVAWRGTPPMYAGPVNQQQMSQSIVCKGHDYFWVRDGVQNVAQGYISNRVTINGEGVRRRVLCFSQDGYLVAETYSSAVDGVYRFDHLWLNRRYMLVAQDDPAFGPADYNAVAADYQAPTPYTV